MSHGYRAVGWTPHKKVYDAVLAGGVVLYLAVFVGVGIALDANATIETQLIRALGTCALLLLHVILAIGPLARLDRRFLPLLYNRRHLGVTMFTVALGHAVFAIVQFHALGDVNPLVSLLVSNTQYQSVSQFPFEALGLVALLILFAMAATSHDFWLANLTAPVWKSLHMLVYVAYALIVLHVALGVLQAERHPVLAGLLGAGLVILVTLHVVAGQRERAGDRACDRGADAVGVRRGLPARRHPREAGAHRDARRRARRDLPLRRQGLRDLQRLPAPERSARRREDRRRLYHLSVARLSIPARDRRVAAAVHREGAHLPRAPRRRSRAGRSAAEPTGHPHRAGDGADMNDDPNDDLYVGYLPAAPPRVARFVRRVAPALVIAAAAIAGLLAALQASVRSRDLRVRHRARGRGHAPRAPLPDAGR